MLTQPLLLQGPPGSPLLFVSRRTFSFVYLGNAWGAGSLTADPSLATVARTLSWACGCLCPFVTPCWTLDPEAAERALGWEAGNPDFSWDVPLTVNPGNTPAAGLLGPVGTISTDGLIAEDSSISDSESKETADWEPVPLSGGDTALSESMAPPKPSDESVFILPLR